MKKILLIISLFVIGIAVSAQTAKNTGRPEVLI